MPYKANLNLIVKRLKKVTKIKHLNRCGVRLSPCFTPLFVISQNCWVPFLKDGLFGSSLKYLSTQHSSQAQDKCCWNSGLKVYTSLESQIQVHLIWTSHGKGASRNMKSPKKLVMENHGILSSLKSNIKLLNSLKASLEQFLNVFQKYWVIGWMRFT